MDAMLCHFSVSSANDDVGSMLGSLRRTIRAYGVLELRVTALLARRFALGCASCGGRCCEVDICREAVESDWLRLLSSSSGERGAAFDPIQGWRSPSGCRLPIGRPPICYEFLCTHALDYQPDSRHRECLMAAAALVPSVGVHALGKRHLVTLPAADIFGRLDTKRLRARILTALARLNEIEATLSEAPLWLAPGVTEIPEMPILLEDVVSENVQRKPFGDGQPLVASDLKARLPAL